MQAFPEVAKFELIDYKVRILDQGHGTDAITRVLIETSDGAVLVGHGRRRPQRDRGVVGGAASTGSPSGCAGTTPEPDARSAASVACVSELHDLTALEQGAAVRRGEVSPLELVDHYLARADDVGAFVTRTPELARDRAAG